MYFEDLSDYPFGIPDARALSIGWLAAGHTYPVSAIDSAIRDELVRIARDPANLMRGLHYCEFCDTESPIVATVPGEEDQPAYLGTGEIRVGNQDVVFVAPTLLIHYIDVHSYSPPPEFQDAVRALTAGV